MLVIVCKDDKPLVTLYNAIFSNIYFKVYYILYRIMHHGLFIDDLS